MKCCDSQEVDGEAMVITEVDESVWATLPSSWNPTLMGMIGPRGPSAWWALSLASLRLVACCTCHGWAAGMLGRFREIA